MYTLYTSTHGCVGSEGRKYMMHQHVQMHRYSDQMFAHVRENRGSRQTLRHAWAADGSPQVARLPSSQRVPSAFGAINESSCEHQAEHKMKHDPIWSDMLS